jgi:hypothetical protein
MNQSERLRNIAAQGWIAMAIIFLASLLMDLARFTTAGTPEKWVEGLGMTSVYITYVMFSIYILMPFLITNISARWFRFFVAGMSMFATLFIATHELSHFLAGNKPFGFSHALDITNHIVGIWVSVVAVKWYRLRD